MPVELLTVTEAAREFLQKAGYPFAKLVNAQFDQLKNEWVLQFDVGIASAIIKKVTLDSGGKALSFG